jgi:hypothetical protein
MSAFDDMNDFLRDLGEPSRQRRQRKLNRVLGIRPADPVEVARKEAEFARRDADIARREQALRDRA